MMADLRYTIHGHISHPDGTEKTVGGSDDDRSTDDYELKQEADIAAHILDQPYDDNPDVTDLPPVLKSHDNVYNMAYLVNMDLAPLGPLKDLEGVSRHLHPQHKGPHVDFGKASIASITGAPDIIGSDKANISSLVHEDNVGVESTSLDTLPMNPNGPANLPPMGPNDTTTINGIVYNSRGYEVCGQLNQHSKPCQRIGRCPFHGGKKLDGSVNGLAQTQTSITTSSLTEPQPVPQALPQPQHQTPLPPNQNHASELERAPILHPAPPVKKAPYKQGWTKDEHIRFLNGLQIHGKGAWKEIAQIVGSRTPTQIQSHAQKYYLRQKQEVKNKRSIHDLSLEDLSEADNAQTGGNSRTPASHMPPYSPMTAPPASQTPQDPASNTLGMLFSSFYRGAPSGNTNINNASTSESSSSSNSTMPHLVGQSYTHSSTFRTPPPPMAQPVFSSASLHSNTLLPHLNSAHHNSLPPLSAPTTSLSHAPAAPIPTNLYSNWFSNTFSAPAGSKMFSLPDFGLDDEVNVGDGLGVEDMHQSPSSNSVRNLISINDDDHPPLTHHLPHPPYPHDDDDKLTQFSSSYMSIPTIPRIDEDSNELPPLTGGSRKRHFIDDEKILNDTNGIREKFRSSPPHQQGVSLPLYLGTLNHSP